MMPVLKSPMNDRGTVHSIQQNFGGFILDHLRRHPHSKWINGTSHQEKNYEDVAEEAVVVHAALGYLGLGAGQKILLLLSNRAQILSLIVGAACANVAIAYDFPGYAADIIIDSKRDLHFDAIFCEYEDVEEALKLPSSLTTVKHIIVLGEPARKTECIMGRAFTWERFLRMGEKARISVEPRVEYIEKQFCYMTPTSGTTGKPKTVVHSHESLLASVQANSHPHHMGLNDKDVLLCTGTLGHVYALFECVFRGIAQGASTVFLEKANTDVLLQALEQHKVSTLATVPYIAKCLLDHPQRIKYDLSCLERVVTGTNYISEDVARSLFEELKLKSYVQLYGQSEAIFIAAGLQDSPPRYGSIGRLGMGVQAMVIDKTGKPLGPGQRGELVIRGPGLMLGYWGRMEESFTDANGWYRTGDECYYDDGEWIYLVQRLGEFIQCRNSKIAPSEIEAVLLKCAQVQDCAVVGLPNPEAGQLPHAVVVPKPGGEHLGPEHFQRFVEEKAPRSLWLEGGVTIVDAIPRNKIGKLVRRELLQWILDRHANDGVI